tara:strand:+ start:316 stop:831 length:516 start_codon:yes stop_codon:yes gene_type:complete
MQDYNINLNSITKESKVYSFIVRDDFFKAFESSEVTKANIDIVINAKKEYKKYVLNIKLTGIIKNLLCDLCTEELNIPIKNTTTIILQESKEQLESNDEIIYIQTHQNTINLKSLFFEIITLSIPNKRTHIKDQKGNSECNNDMLKLIEKYMQKEEGYDERWQKLNEIKTI